MADYREGIDKSPRAAELREELKEKSLSTKLKEMGFDERTFMVVKGNSWDTVKVSDGNRDEKGQLVENPYASFGGTHKHPSNNYTDYRVSMSDFELYDNEMLAKRTGNTTEKYFDNGLVGSNNGVYAAKANGGEMIITEDPDIYYALRDQLDFRDGMGVPMSNGGIIMDPKKNQEFESMKWACARKADREGQEKRTAAVQRGDIITTYDPNDKGSDGVYRNVRHYEKQSNGDFRAISKYEASDKLGLKMQYEANTPQSIATGQKLDGAETSKMLANKFIDYRGR